jgi:hypothetical protein
VDDIVYEVDCQTITVKEGADVNIGSFILFSLDNTCDIFTQGANPSAEEQEEATEDGAKTVNNVVHSFRLQTTAFDKKSFLTYLKVLLPSHLVRAVDQIGPLLTIGIHESGQGKAPRG